MIMFTPVADWSLGCERWTDLASCRWTNDVMLRFPDVLPACCPWRMVPKILTAPYNQSLKRYSSHNRHRPSSHTTRRNSSPSVPRSVSRHARSRYGSYDSYVFNSQATKCADSHLRFVVAFLYTTFPRYSTIVRIYFTSKSFKAPRASAM